MKTARVLLLAACLCLAGPGCQHEAVSPATPAPTTTVSFLGLSTPAQRVVFICDAHGGTFEFFDSLRRELRKAIAPMSASQQVNIVFEREHAPPLLSPSLLSATPENKRRLFEYIDRTEAQSSDDPDPAIKAAFSMQPDAIIFVAAPACWQAPDATVALCEKLNIGRKVKVIAISLQDAENDRALAQIAGDSGGVFMRIDPLNFYP